MRLTANNRKVLKHPGAFALRVLKGFRANQGLLLAGAVAYYTLLSLVPLLILVMIVLSHAIDSERLLVTLNAYLEFVVPVRSDALVDELRTRSKRWARSASSSCNARTTPSSTSSETPLALPRSSRV